METVPQIVRERLKAGVSVGSHPDADVLTAFAERSLGDRERASVVEHLARCGECRDVVMLALPETEAVDLVARPSRNWWMTWPAFRWGFATAGVAIVVALGILQFQRRSQTTTSATMAKQSSHLETVATDLESRSASQPATAAPAAERVAPSSIAMPALAKKESPKLLEKGRQTLSAQVPVNQLHPRATGGTREGPAMGPRMPMQWQQQQQQTPSRMQAASPSLAAKQQSGSSANIPPSPQTVEVPVQSAAPLINTESATTATQLASAPVPTPPADKALDYYASAPVAKSKPATALQPGAAWAAGISAPRWSISSTGGLQRSLDQGATWQDVDVNVNSVPAANFVGNTTTMEAAAARSRAKDKASDKKSQPTEAAPLVFRAVAANGPDVWAGGTSAALYHSLDAGHRWARVLPSSGGAVLAGDVVAVQFSDTQHGTVTTSTGEVWGTGDGGQTWQKQ
jgi:hypothetical protein